MCMYSCSGENYIRGMHFAWRMVIGEWKDKIPCHITHNTRTRAERVNNLLYFSRLASVSEAKHIIYLAVVNQIRQNSEVECVSGFIISPFCWNRRRTILAEVWSVEKSTEVVEHIIAVHIKIEIQFTRPNLK